MHPAQYPGTLPYYPTPGTPLPHTARLRTPRTAAGMPRTRANPPTYRM